MVSSYTPNKRLEKPANGDYVDTWNIPVNGDMDIIDKAFGGTFGVSMTSSNVTLTQVQAQNVNINVTGALSANVTLYFPNGVSGFWIVTNATSGTTTLTLAVASSAGTTVLAPRNLATMIWSDGTNIRYADDDRTTLSAGTGITIAGSTISLTIPVAVANGGTGATTAAGALTSLGAVPTTRTISTSGGLTGGGDLSANRTLSIATGGVTGTMLASTAVVDSLGYTPVNRAGDTMTGALNIGANGEPLTINSTNSNGNKIILQDNATVRGYIGATSTACLVVRNNTASTTTLTIDNSGNVTAAANITAYSDARLKKDLKEIHGAVDFLKTISGYVYTRLDNGQEEVGLIAQQIGGKFPQLVKQNDEYLSLAYDRMAALFVQAIKELDKRIEALEAK